MPLPSHVGSTPFTIPTQVPLQDPARPAALLAIIDGHHHAYRSFWSMPQDLTGPDGRPTGVTFAFAALFQTLRDHPGVTHWACVFDPPDGGFRRRLASFYKAHRPPMPDLLKRQMPDVMDLCAATGVPVLRVADFEGDDVIATVARSAAAEGFAVRAITGDRDLDQLLDDGRIRIWDVVRDRLRSAADLHEDLGLRPAQVADWRCMVGDRSDGIPGIKGVGPVRARKLLAAHGTLDGVLAAADGIAGNLGERVRAYRDADHALTRQLVTLVTVPGLPAPESLRIDRNQVLDAAVYLRCGLSLARFRARAPVALAVTRHPAPDILAPGSLPAWLAGRLTGQDRAPIAVALMQDRAPGSGVETGVGAALADLESSRAPACAWLPASGPADDEGNQTLRALLADANVPKAVADGRAAARWCQHRGWDLRGVSDDLAAATWLLDPAAPAPAGQPGFSQGKSALAALAHLHLGESDPPAADAPGQALADAWRVARLAPRLRARIAGAGMLPVYREQELPLAPCLAGLDAAGIRIDRAELERRLDHLRRYRDQALGELRGLIGGQAGLRFAPDDQAQVRDLLARRLGLSLPPPGTVIDAVVLQVLRHRHEAADLLLQVMALDQLFAQVGTAFTAACAGHATGELRADAAQDEDGRILPGFKALAAMPRRGETGSELRAAVVPAPGRVFIAGDCPQLALRVQAHLSGDAGLVAACAAADPHRAVAAALSALGDDAGDEAAVGPAQRESAKCLGAGLASGLSAYGIARRLGVDKAAAERLSAGWRERFRAGAAWLAKLVDDATVSGAVRTLGGRRRAVSGLIGGDANTRLVAARVGLSAVIQGGAADIVRRALIRLATDLPAGAHLVLAYGDSVLVEAVEDAAERAATVMRAILSEARFSPSVALSVPVPARVRIGRSWLEVS